MANFTLQTVVKQTPQSQGERGILCMFKDTVYLLPMEECKTTKSLTASVQSTLFLDFLRQGAKTSSSGTAKNFLALTFFNPAVINNYFEKSSATLKYVHH